jgi:hypothetical protein
MNTEGEAMAVTVKRVGGIWQTQTTDGETRCWGNFADAMSWVMRDLECRLFDAVGWGSEVADA